ncbi:MAG: sigma-54-dependent Fis family transcriptional regulator [Bdellovibrionaceae bacterium]|nr:sigma-54-dependent Fis family transcriptional regulator [Pseudobdellovibrionaceae bacterium]
MSLQLNLLVVDDDSLVLETLRQFVETPWNFIGKTQYNKVEETIHAAFVDLHLSGNIQKNEGLEVIRTISEHHPHAEIIAISGDLSRDLMEKTLKAGATRFLPKPLTPDEVELTLNKLEAYFQLRFSQQGQAARLIGSSEHANSLRRQIAELKGEKSPILLYAESGCGKDVVAHILNEQEPTRPFVSINVSSIAENLFESEMFGYTKGAFTGAQQSKIGLLESAHGGDLFLDEIEALPLSQQPKLLRFLENGEVRRVGANETIHVSTRLIAATNEDLQKMVQDGKFREDLYWRLSGHKIHIPPLSERKEDIAELCAYFVGQSTPRRNKTFSEDAIERLQSYNWPGNIRELRRVTEQLLLIAPLPIIRSEDVKKILSPATIESKELKFDFNKSLADLVSDYEKQAIEAALHIDKDVESLIKLLKISRSSLYKKIKDYNLNL